MITITILMKKTSKTLHRGEKMIVMLVLHSALFLIMSFTLPDTQYTFLETIKETQQMSSNVAPSAHTINLQQQSLEKEDKNGWLFYSGIPKSGTIYLHQYVIETGRF